jgi:predicted ribosomally synthesized peptide with nif11-like leader
MQNEELRRNVMENFNEEMIEKAKAAKSAEELLEIVKANGIELTADEAATYFAQLNPKSGELDDDALDCVAGGCGASVGTRVEITSSHSCPNCGSKIGIVSTGGHNGSAINCERCDTHIVNMSNMKLEYNVL